VPPKVYNSTLHLQYFNPHQNSSYVPPINNHNAIARFQKISGFDYSASFGKKVLDQYPANITRILLEYNDTSNSTFPTNGIVQGLGNASYTWIGYDDECGNGAQSTPYVEIAKKSNWKGAGPEAPCNPYQGASSLNASAIGNYTNDASLRVKNAGKHFVWTGQLAAVNATYSTGRYVYQYVNWTRIDMVNLQLQGQTYSGSNNFTVFNSTLAKISDFVRTHNPNTLIFVQVIPGTDSKCGCTMASITYTLQYARFHAGTPTKWMYDGVTMSIGTTPPASVDTFDTYLGR